MSDYEYMLKELKTTMIYRAQFFASIMYERGLVELTTNHKVEGSVKRPDGSYEDVQAEVPMWRGVMVPTAMTDGRHIVFNPAFMQELNLSGRLFVAAHEVFHLMSRHPTRFQHYKAAGLHGEPFDYGLANLAADIVINKCLQDADIGEFPVGKDGEPVGVDPVHWTKKLMEEHSYTLTGLEPWEDVYKLLLNKQAPKPEGASGGESGEGAGGESGEGAGGKMGGDVGSPSTAGGEIPSEAEMKATVKSAAASAKSRGSMPGNLKTLVDEFVEPKVPWAEELATEIKANADPDAYDWSRGNRRKIVMPGIYVPRRVGTSAGDIVMAVDTSGSVSDKELKAGISEIAAILSECRPNSLHVIWCDAQVDRVDKFDSPEDLQHTVRVRGVGGRGGTSFVPPFEHVMENGMEVDMFIYITDGYAPFPDESMAEFPVIWLITSDVQAPFGKNIKLDV